MKMKIKLSGISLNCISTSIMQRWWICFCTWWESLFFPAENHILCSQLFLRSFSPISRLDPFLCTSVYTHRSQRRSSVWSKMHWHPIGSKRTHRARRLIKRKRLMLNCLCAFIILILFLHNKLVAQLGDFSWYYAFRGITTAGWKLSERSERQEKRWQAVTEKRKKNKSERQRAAKILLNGARCKKSVVVRRKVTRYNRKKITNKFKLFNSCQLK